MQVISRLSDGYGVVAETSGFCMAKRRKALLNRNRGKQSAIQRKSRRAVWTGATASALAVALACAVAGPAMAVPREVRQVHVEGQLIPVRETPGVYRVTGGLVGRYNVRSERVSYAWTYWDTQIRDIHGTASINGCIDQNQNQTCEPAELSSDLRLIFDRVASFDTETGRLLEGSSTHQLSSGKPFSGGVLTSRDIPVHNSDGVVLTYEGDLDVIQPKVNSKRAE